MKKWKNLIAGLGFLCLMGCTVSQAPAEDPPPTVETEPQPTETVEPPTPSPTETPIPPEPTAEPENEMPELFNHPQVAKAREDLADRVNISADSIEILVVEERDWPDSSAGCPQEGMMYMQVITNGMYIRLRADGKIYNYHSAGGRDPFLCDKK